MKRSFITAITFLIVILLALLWIGPKEIQQPEAIVIDIESGDYKVKDFNYRCLCTNIELEELRWYKYYAMNMGDAKTLCDDMICQDFFGLNSTASETKALNIETNLQ